MDEAKRLCDRIVLLDHGKILDEGPVADLLARGQASSLDDLFLKLAGRRIVE